MQTPLLSEHWLADEKSVETRLDRRYPCSLEAQIAEISGTGLEGTGTVLELSHSGLRIWIPFQVTLGHILQIEIGPHRLWGHVVHCRRDGAGTTAGVELESVLLGSTDVSQLLRGLLEDALTDVAGGTTLKLRS